MCWNRHWYDTSVNNAEVSVLLLLQHHQGQIIIHFLCADKSHDSMDDGVLNGLRGLIPLLTDNGAQAIQPILLVGCVFGFGDAVSSCCPTSFRLPC